LLRQLAPPAAARRTLTFDAYDLASFTDVAARFGQRAYGFVVTPNADHLIRLDEEASFRALYTAADYVLLDSRFLSKLLRLAGGPRLPVCTGSDLTATLLRDVIVPHDPLVLIGCSDRQTRQLAERYGLKNLAHFNPPMGFIRDPDAVEDCLRFVEAHSPFRFCLLAVGAPQQEVVAQLLKARGRARGLALCIGASINFLTGEEQRAPVWMQRAGIEWAYRLSQNPRRLARRYLVRGPRVFGVLRRADVVLRQPSPLLRLVAASPASGALARTGAPSLPVGALIAATGAGAVPDRRSGIDRRANPFRTGSSTDRSSGSVYRPSPIERRLAPARAGASGWADRRAS